jgi:Inner membrane protein YgaP-like, transmembrane domain
MTVERLIRIIAGGFILLSLVLAHVYNGVDLLRGPTWLWFTAFVGANLLQSGFTRWCLMEQILKRVGVKSGCVQQGGAS